MKRKLAIIGLATLVLCAVALVVFSRQSIGFQDRDALMAPASAQHWTGTDSLGRDRTLRVAGALLLGLAGATAAAAITVALAACFGLLAAFSGRRAASVLTFVSDIFLSLPWLFLLMLVRSWLPLTASPMQTAVVTFLILAALGWPACSRAVYRGSLALRASEWMIQSHASGLRTRQILRRHLLPHLLPLLLPQFLICVPAFLVAETNLGAMGLGIGEPLPSWGSMLLELQNSALLAQSHWVYLPIALLVVTLVLLETLTSEVKTNA